MDKSHQALISELVSAQVFVTAINEAFEHERQHLMQALRSEARGGNSVRTAIAEGRLQELERFIPLLKDYASK